MTSNAPKLRSCHILENMRYEIILSSGAEDDLDQLRASDRTKVLDAIDRHLRYEPEKTSKSRIKRLRDFDRPQYRLRVDDLRVFYDVLYEVNGGLVEILAIKQKDESVVWLIENGE